MTLVIEGFSYPMVWGSGCWDGLCGDTFAIRTQTDPVIVHAPATGLLELGISEPPDKVMLRVIRVAGWQPLRDAWGLLWPWGDHKLAQPLPLVGPRTVRMPRWSGLAVVAVDAHWPGDHHGDSSYGLLLRIDAPAYIPRAALHGAR